MKDNFEAALEFATMAHRGQLDNGWTPYIMHILGVWSRLREENLTTQIAALLHDVVEDTDAASFEVLAQRFGVEVAEIVELLTHTKGMKYSVYIENIAQSGNRSAILVKLADLADNSSQFRLQRLPASKQEYFKKRIVEKYAPAQARLIKALEEL